MEKFTLQVLTIHVDQSHLNMGYTNRDGMECYWCLYHCTHSDNCQATMSQKKQKYYLLVFMHFTDHFNGPGRATDQC